jgi:serine protease inhibitor
MFDFRKPFYFKSNIGDKNAQDIIYIPMMMGSSDILYHKNEDLGFSAMGLPYKGNKFVSYFVLPDLNVNLRDLVNKMDGKILQNITRNTIPLEFTYFVPKMTLKSFTNLRPALQVNI